MKNLLLLFFSFILVFFIFSCADGNNSSGKQEHTNNGPTKIVFVNKTDYEVKEIYYKQTSDFDSGDSYGTEILNASPLADKNNLIICPNFINSYESEPYYFTFKRQKGSTDNDFYITTDTPILLSNTSGIVTIELLPYKFHYTIVKNLEKTCNDGTQNGE